MNVASPLRYPGGKAAITPALRQIRRINALGTTTVVEPFAGGAGAALSLLYLEDTPEIHINDADPAIYDFWWAVLRRPKQFAELVEKTPVSVAEWKRQRSAYRTRSRIARITRAFATFYLNRCNRSGIIIDGGPIGGLGQSGNWAIDARFNKPTLLSRLEKVAAYRERIRVTGVDGLELIGQLDADATFFFIDPPYFHKGDLLYLNTLDSDYHTALAERLSEMKHAAWVLTYDDCREVRKLYRGWTTIRPFTLSYSASGRSQGHEVLIAPTWMRLPSDW